MPLRKSNQTRAQWEKDAWATLLDRLTRAAAIGRLAYFLELGLSPHERSMLIKRIAALDRLSEGMTFRGIDLELHLSLQTINSIKKSLSAKTFSSYSQYSKTTRKKKKKYVAVQSEGRDPLKRPHNTKYGKVYY